MPNRNKGSSLRAMPKNNVTNGQREYGPKARKKIDGPTVFQRSFRESSAFSGCPMSDMGLIRASREAWKNLSTGQKEQYELEAKRINAQNLEEHGTTWQRDLYGRSLLEQEEKVQKKEQWEKKSERIMEGMLNGPREDIIEKDFFIITGNTFLNTYGAKRPEDIHVILAEVTILRFSIKSGRKGITTFFPRLDPEHVPKGHMADALDSVDDHGIPVESSQGLNVVEAQHAIGMINQFVGSTKEGIPPLFTRLKDVDKIRSGLVYLYNLSGSRCPWADEHHDGIGRIYPFEKFTAVMTNRGIAVSGSDRRFELQTRNAERLWQDPPTITMGNECCEFHSAVDLSLACSQAHAMACLWWNMNYCARYFNVPITKNHLPACIRDKGRAVDQEPAAALDDDDWPQVPPTGDLPDLPTATAGAAAFPPARPAKGGRGRGVTLEESPSPARGGRGRGRAMRGRLPTSWD